MPVILSGDSSIITGDKKFRPTKEHIAIAIIINKILQDGAQNVALSCNKSRKNVHWLKHTAKINLSGFYRNKIWCYKDKIYHDVSYLICA